MKVYQKKRNVSQVPEINEGAEETRQREYARIREEDETKRKNSVRRYIGVAYKVVSKAQREEENEIVE